MIKKIGLVFFVLFQSTTYAQEKTDVMIGYSKNNFYKGIFIGESNVFF